MSYRLERRDASLTDALRRIALAEIDAIRAAHAAGPQDPAAVHEMRKSFKKLRALLRPGMGLEVDGGVAPATIARCHEAGANLMVAGSAIYDQRSPGEAWQALTALVADA